MTTEIAPASFRQIGDWLLASPFEWGQTLALRAILRTLPEAFSKETESEWLRQYGIVLFRGLFTGWSTCVQPVKKHKSAAEQAFSALYAASMTSGRAAFLASSIRALNSSIRSSRKSERVAEAMRSLQSALRFTASDVSDLGDKFIRPIFTDIEFLISNGVQRNSATRDLIARPLLIRPDDSSWKIQLGASLDNLSKVDTHFQLWCNWTALITRPGVKEFCYSNSISKLSDRNVAVNLIHNTENIWDLPTSEFSPVIMRWIADADFSGKSAGIPKVPPQNPHFIQFRRGADGRIELNREAGHAEIRIDDDAIDRYNECRSLALSILSQCAMSNTAGRFKEMLENYIEASGDSIGSIRPSLFVQRGERLRQEIDAQTKPDSMLPPLPDEILLDLFAWQSAHNLVVGLDPALAARDFAILGPDAFPANVPPNEIRTIARAADSEGILGVDVANVVMEAANLAPTIPSPLDRRTIWSVETGRNLVIEAFNLALVHPGKSIAGLTVAGVAVTASPPAATLLSATAMAIPAARFLLKNRDWIEDRLGSSPTWKSLFLDLCNWLENNGPKL